MSNVAKLVTKGQRTSRGHVREGALDRPEVEALAESRAAERAARAAEAPWSTSPWTIAPITDHALAVATAGCRAAGRHAASG